MARIIGEVRPRYAFVENSPLLVSRGLTTVLGDLAEMGYDARWGVLGAVDAGAPHRRDRIWIMANAKHAGIITTENSGKDNRIQQESKAGEIIPVNEFERAGCLRPKELRLGISPIGIDEDVAHTDSDRSNGRRQCGRWTQGIYESTTPIRSNDDIPASRCRETMADANEVRSQRQRPDDATCGRKDARGQVGLCDRADYRRSIDWWATEPAICGVDDGLGSELDVHGAASTGYLGRVATGVQARVDRLKAIGNGQVPLCAALAWKILTGATALGDGVE